jgi:hypothetical protein
MTTMVTAMKISPSVIAVDGMLLVTSQLPMSFLNQ